MDLVFATSICIRKMETKRQNNSIQLIRFLLCCIVCLFHLTKMDKRIFASGYLCVDIFFIMCGFFLKRHFTYDHSEGTSEQLAIKYLKTRLIRIIPHHIFSWICMAAIKVFIIKNHTISDVFYGWSELFLLQAIGIGDDISMNGVSWYLGALLFCSYFIYWILCSERKRGDYTGNRFTFVIAPLCFCVVMSYIWFSKGHLNYWTQKANILTGGIMRGFSGISLGCIAYEIAIYLERKIKRSRFSRTIASVFEVGGWLLVFRIMYTKGGAKDFFIPILGALLIISMYSSGSYFTQLTNNKISGYLGRISFAMYLNQRIIIRPMQAFFPGRSIWLMGAIMLPCVFVLSVFTDWIIGKVVSILRQKNSHFRNLQADS